MKYVRVWDTPHGTQGAKSALHPEGTPKEPTPSTGGGGDGGNPSASKKTQILHPQAALPRGSPQDC